MNRYPNTIYKKLSNFRILPFAELSKQNITSEQLLYLWSTPIDFIEDYQHYLDDYNTPDCLDQYDEHRKYLNVLQMNHHLDVKI